MRLVTEQVRGKGRWDPLRVSYTTEITSRYAFPTGLETYVEQSWLCHG
jgi:hypothetical protein